MDQWVKELNAKSKDLSSVTRTHLVEEKSQLLEFASDLYRQGIHVYMYTHNSHI